MQFSVGDTRYDHRSTLIRFSNLIPAKEDALVTSKTDERFARLERLPASSSGGFANEPTDFTPWLADNLDRLGEEIGIRLEFREREHQVGRYSLDLLLADKDERVVIVENQFGRTDHDHLGKLLTYCAGTRATVVVWIAESFTEEHAAALTWLNENSGELGVEFFGVQLTLLRIAGSKMAVDFSVIVRPDTWVRRNAPARTPRKEWSWETYAKEPDLKIPEDRLALGHEIDDQIRALLKDKSLPWEPVFRKGYLAFQRKGGYNVLIVDVLWNRPVRLAVKLPDSLDNLEDSNPYPELDGFWSPGEREWGWHVPSMELVPDIGKFIELASIHTPESGPVGPPAAD